MQEMMTLSKATHLSFDPTLAFPSASFSLKGEVYLVELHCSWIYASLSWKPQENRFQSTERTQNLNIEGELLVSNLRWVQFAVEFLKVFNDVTLVVYHGLVAEVAIVPPNLGALVSGGSPHVRALLVGLKEESVIWRHVLITT